MNIPASHLRHVSDFGPGDAGPAVAGEAAEDGHAAVGDRAPPDHHRQRGRLAATARTKQTVAENMQLMSALIIGYKYCTKTYISTI